MKSAVPRIFGQIAAAVVVIVAGSEASAGSALNGRIAFTSFRYDGAGDIFTVNPDGSDLVQLTNHPDYDAQGDWSPDGQKIAFRARRDPVFWRGSYSPAFEVYLMDLYGNKQQRLTTSSTPPNYSPKPSSTQPGWHPNSQQMLFRSNRSGDSEIWEMDLSGKILRQVVKFPGDQIYPVYSPDGSKIAFANVMGRVNGREDRGIYLMNADGTNVVSILDTYGVFESAPNWSPDGTELAFESNIDGDMDIYVMNSDGSNIRQVTFNTSHDEGAAWSPDGLKLVFSSDVGQDSGGQETWIINRDGSNPVRLFQSPGIDESPDWQPIPLDGDYDPCGDTVASGSGAYSVMKHGVEVTCDEASALATRWSSEKGTSRAKKVTDGYSCEATDAGYSALKVVCTHRGNRADDRGNDKKIAFLWR